MASLHSWQLPIAEKLYLPLSEPRGRVLCGTPTGSGKTYLACHLMERLQRPVLVIAPIRTHSAWRRVAEDFGVDKLIEDIINVEKISRGSTRHFDGRTWRVKRDLLCAWDEVHRGCNGATSLAAQALMTLSQSSARIMPMTATLASSPLQLRSVGNIFGLFGPSLQDFYRWASGHGCYYDSEKRRWQFRPTGISKNGVIERIRGEFGRRIVSMPVEEIPNFPSNTVRAKIYDLAERDKAEMQEAYLRMPPALLRPGSSDDVDRLRARQRVEACRVNLMAEIAANDIEDGLSPVLFLNFRDSVQRIVKILAEKYHITNVTTILGGASTAAQKQAQQDDIDKFQANINVCAVSSLESGGTGVNLHDVHHARRRVSYLSPGENASSTLQALGRICRDGGTAAVQTFVCAAATVEERVYKSVNAKMANIATLNNEDLAT